MLSHSAVRVGAVRGRYFRENFAQGGLDLVQIVPELVTNADEAIAAGGRGHGRIELRFGRRMQRLLLPGAHRCGRCGRRRRRVGASRSAAPTMVSA